MSIACILYRRLKHPKLLPKARWSLGRFGPIINGGALIYSLFLFFWCFWPLQTPIDSSTFNWAALMFTTLVVASGITYLLGGRREYVSPVALVKNERVVSQA